MLATLEALVALSLFGLISGVPGEHQHCLVRQQSVATNRSSAVALVLARGGSKGIPLKNLQKVEGISLLGRSLQTIRDSDIFDEVWVSTDHDAIAAEAERYGAQVHFRPAVVAQDRTTSIESVQEFLQHHPHIHNIALVQCTSVFLQADYLRAAMQAFAAADCVFSVVRSFKLRWQWRATDQRLVPVNFDANRRPRRQDWNGELIEAGMFYVARRDLLQSGRFQNDRCRFVEVAPEDSLEIDTPADLELAGLLLKQRQFGAD